MVRLTPQWFSAGIRLGAGGLLCLALALATSACGGDDSPPAPGLLDISGGGPGPGDGGVVDAGGDSSGPQSDAGPATGCQSDDDCVAEAACRVGSCDTASGECQFETAEGSCWIEEVCYGEGEGPAEDACQRCESASNTLAVVSCPEGELCDPGTGECQAPPDDFGTACTVNSDCQSGYCIPGTLGASKVCSQLCEESCPEGYACADSVCRSPDANLCKPCGSDEDCRADAASPDARCLATPDAGGSFCGIPCGAEGACPDGYSCDEAAADGAGQCVPAAGACGCSAWASEIGASTPCGVGACAGSRSCGAEGLGACDGPEPGTESCNGEDDDCDGEADEDFKQQDVIATNEHCGACGVVCELPNANGVCEVVFGEATCVLESCDPGYVENQDGGCTPVSELSDECAPCATSDDCPADTACTVVGGAKFCLRPCSADGDCDAGFACTNIGGPSFCLYGSGGCAQEGSDCGNDADCEDLNDCTLGTCGAGGCELANNDAFGEACYEGPEGTEGTGLCAGGNRSCVDGQITECVGQVTPVEEICDDGEDNNCDGTPDEGCGDAVVTDLLDRSVYLSGPVGTSGLVLEAVFSWEPLPAEDVPDAPVQVDFGLFPVEQ